MIVALVTLYNPDIDVKSNLKTILNQVDLLYACDNSPSVSEEFVKVADNYRYIFNNGNLALSGAFNKILKNTDIRWNEDDYIFFFDQDSYIEPGHIDKMIDEYNFLESSGYRIGCLGPVYFNRTEDAIAKRRIKKPLTDNSYIVKSIITSSLLTRYKTLKEVDFWNEDVFLDMADWDLVWRIVKKGYLCVETSRAVLNHNVGYGYKKVGFIRMGESSLVREYYQTKNSIYLLKKQYTPIRFKLKFLKILFIRPFLHYLFMDNKQQRMKLITEAHRDYKKKYYGEYRR